MNIVCSEDNYYVERISEFCLLFSYFQAGITHNTVMYVAIFYVFPLQIAGIMEINKKVHQHISWVWINLSKRVQKLCKVINI